MVDKERYIYEAQRRSLPVPMSPWWMDAVSRGKHWEGLVVEEQGHVVGLMALHWTERYGVKFAATPLLTPMSPVWIADDELPGDDAHRLAERVLATLVDDIRHLGIDYLQIKTGRGQCADVFRKVGFGVSERWTYIIDDISRPSALLPLYHPMKRRYVNKAMRSGFVFSDKVMNASSYYDVYQRIIASRGQSVQYDKDYFVSLAEAAVSHGQGGVFTLARENTPVETSLFCVWDGERAYAISYWTKAEAKNSGSSSLIFHRAIEHVSPFVRIFDFEGGFEDNVGASYSKFATRRESYLMIQKPFSFKGWVLAMVLKVVQTCWALKK